MLRRGFTLIEVVISIAVMAIIFIPVFSLFSSSRMTLKISGDMAHELSAARSAMEFYNAKDYMVLHNLLRVLQSRGESISSPSLYCFIEYSDISRMSAMLESFDAEHCKVYQDINNYNEIKEISSIKYDEVLKIDLYETSDVSTYTKAIEIVVTAWSSLRGSSSMVRLVCMKGACV